MNEELKEQMNNGTDSTEGLSQDKFEDLFKSLNESYINEMLERAGLSEDGPAEDIFSEDDPAEDDPAPAEEPQAAEGSIADADTGESAISEGPAADIDDAIADTPVPEAAEGGELEPEHIGHLLKVLGEDMINDMLQDAGLTEEDLAQDGVPADGEAETADDSQNTGSAPKRKRVSRKGRRTRRFLLLGIFAGIILMVFAVNQISMNVTLNSDDPIQYSEQADDISALEGSLIVNDVSVNVPTDGSEEYSISYTWAEDDDKYPSVPQAITAVYKGKGEEGEEDAKLYTISLYRSETIKKKAIPKGKNTSNWFDDWETVAEGDVLQKPWKSGSINGFYIYPQINEEGDGTTSGYNDYSYYFAVRERGGISIYVVEGVCLDENSVPAFYGIMDKCIKSITIEKSDEES